MNIRNSRGFVLSAVIMFIIIAMIDSVGLYLSTYSVSKTTGINEVEYIKGYYLDMAALRFASMLLKCPNDNFVYGHDGFGYNPMPIDIKDPNTIYNNHLLTAVGVAKCAQFVQDMGLDLVPNRDIIIYISLNWDSHGVDYDVSASYSY